MIPPSFVLACALPEVRRPLPGQGFVVPAALRSGPARVDANGISQVFRRSILCLCSVPGPRPNRCILAFAAASMLPPLSGRRRLRRWLISGLTRKLRHLLSYASRPRCRSRAKLASGWLAQPLPGGSRTHWIATRGFSSCCRSSSPPALLTLPDCASLHPGYQLGLPATTKWRRSAARQLQAACPNSDIENLESKHRRVSLKHRVITRK